MSNTSEKPANIDPYLLTTKELADRLGLPVRTVKWLIASHKIPKVRLGHRTLRFRFAAVAQAIEQLEKLGKPRRYP